MPDNEQTTGQLQKLGPATAAEISKESVSSEVEPGDESADLSTQLAEEVKAEGWYQEACLMCHVLNSPALGKCFPLA